MYLVPLCTRDATVIVAHLQRASFSGVQKAHLTFHQENCPEMEDGGLCQHPWVPHRKCTDVPSPCAREILPMQLHRLRGQPASYAHSMLLCSGPYTVAVPLSRVGTGPGRKSTPPHVAHVAERPHGGQVPL